MGNRAWPTPEEVDANPGRWWWVDGEPSRLGVDRMTHPHRVTWRSRFVLDLPPDMFGGPVATADDVTDAIADAVAAERHNIGKWMRQRPGRDAQWFAGAIEHGDHERADHTVGWHRPPSLRSLQRALDDFRKTHDALTGMADRLAERVRKLTAERAAAVDALEAAGKWSSEQPLSERIETLATERDRRIDPIEHARAVRAAFIHGFRCTAIWSQSADRVAVLARVGPEVLAEVESNAATTIPPT